ncbi:hypothetical protein J6590_037917 [Homalodisca vitripennis]|nr:hypothetical protein J6590_037917 [Homalodisca vitripennis]
MKSALKTIIFGNATWRRLITELLTAASLSHLRFEHEITLPTHCCQPPGTSAACVSQCCQSQNTFCPIRRYRTIIKYYCKENLKGLISCLKRVLVNGSSQSTLNLQVQGVVGGETPARFIGPAAFNGASAFLSCHLTSGRLPIQLNGGAPLATPPL